MVVLAFHYPQYIVVVLAFHYPAVHVRCLSDVPSTDDSKKLNPPAPAVNTVEIVSLKTMLSFGVPVFDFDTTLVKAVD